MNVERVRRDFPFFEEAGAGGRVSYLDNACQSLRPQVVLDAVAKYYLKWSACSGRSMHRLGEEVTRACEETRRRVAKFLNASRSEEIVFTRNTTEGLNLVARSLDWRAGDVVLVSDKEHNSNLLPWQFLAQREGVQVMTLPSRADNGFDLDRFTKSLEGGVRLVSLASTSNLDGVSIPVAEVVRQAHARGALVLIDAAQTAPHRRLDVRALDVDLLAFSGHKMLGPAGTGVLYGKYHLLERLHPFLVGGGTVSTSTYHTCEYLPPPAKFEAGLQDYAGIIGLGAALGYLEEVGFREIERQEYLVNEALTRGLAGLPRLKLIGPADPGERGGIFSFNLEGVDPHRVALMLDQMYGIMVRSGQHCVHSWFGAHGLQGSVRASAYFYNTCEEAELLVAGLKKIAKVL